MLKLRTNLVGIDDGQVVLFSDFEDDGPMWRGEGPRFVHKAVVFSEPFKSKPSVHVAVSMYDISQLAATRMDISAEHITTSGFTISFRTWGDSKIARVRACWRAIGELPDEEVWTL